MALKLALNRKQTFYYENEAEEESFSVTFDFKFSDELDRKSIREKIKSKYPTFTPKETDKVEDLGVDDIDYYMDLQNTTLMGQLVSCSDIFDEEGNLVTIQNEDGSVNEKVQKIVFEYVKTKPTLYKDILKASSGVSVKNSKTGVTQ